MNTTFQALTLSSIGRSPFISYSQLRKPSIFTLHKSFLNHFSSTFLSVNSNTVGAILSNSRASHFLDSVVKINDLLIYREDINNNHSNYSPEINLTVQEMSYDNCVTPIDGGAIFVIFKNSVYCNFSSFSNCSAGNKGGAMYIISNYTNITQGCFTQCSASFGSSIYIPLTYSQFSCEGCTVYKMEKQSLNDSIYSFYSQANDIISSNNNFSLNSLSNFPGPFFSTQHSLNNTYLTISNLSLISTSLAITQKIFQFDGFSTIQNSNYSNIYNCKTYRGDSYIFCCSLDGFILRGFCFTNIELSPDSYLVFANVNQNSYIYFVNCSFCMPKNSTFSNTDNVQTDECLFETSLVTQYPYVTSQGCWAHSHYKWIRPKGYLIGIVVFIIVASLIGAFIYVIVNKRIADKKYAEENASQLEDMSILI